jgi:hypothetical protein
MKEYYTLKYTSPEGLPVLLRRIDSAYYKIWGVEGTISHANLRKSGYVAVSKSKNRGMKFKFPKKAIA